MKRLDEDEKLRLNLSYEEKNQLKQGYRNPTGFRQWVVYKKVINVHAVDLIQKDVCDVDTPGGKQKIIAVSEFISK